MSYDRSVLDRLSSSADGTKLHESAASELDDGDLRTRADSERNSPESRARVDVQQRRVARNHPHGMIEEETGQAPLEGGERELAPVGVPAQRQVDAAVSERGPERGVVGKRDGEGGGGDIAKCGVDVGRGVRRDDPAAGRIARSGN